LRRCGVKTDLRGGFSIRLNGYGFLFGSIGPIAKTVEDCKFVFDAIKGKDLLVLPALSLIIKLKILNLKSLRIGLPKEYFINGIDPKVEELIRIAV
jgi:aspartyl-tRNA(Asn)/glutamyl-tRNA(Gln) amidotransferase subunit A